ncbi:hypothetical protein BpHYR1_051332 [Brachionus plicatilis]|uniref:Uncharacterized protein n=1 Tax=Brachionus plicatilis TaxID=10195 RepID=A0A3M7RBX1_BRAPC|nr:hypothetical protein BpHYR1_051332 [Brachionus plicatilis]
MSASLIVTDFKILRKEQHKLGIGSDYMNMKLFKIKVINYYINFMKNLNLYLRQTIPYIYANFFICAV